VKNTVSICGVLTALALAGCAATKQEVAATLGDRYVGKNVDALVAEFGPPASAFRMNNGGSAYVWQLDAVTSINIDRDPYGSSGTARAHYCKVNVLTSPAGIVTQLTTEDRSGTGGLLGLAGVDIHGSLCAQRLGMPRQNV
jgi:hypothetical protein